MTLCGRILGMEREYLVEKYRRRNVEAVSIRIEKSGTMYNPLSSTSRETAYHVKIYETRRINGKPAFFPDLYVDFEDRRYFDIVAEHAAAKVQRHLIRFGIEAKVDY